MSLISNMTDRQRVWKTLADYPVYSPPFRDWERVFSTKEIEANYDYFQEQKARRQEYLANYLRPFSVDLSLSREALPALDRWLFRYGGHLIPGGDEVIVAMHDYEPAWVHKFHGLNIVHDISIFAGDYIISSNNNVRWDVFCGGRGKRDYEKIGFGQACLNGLCSLGYTRSYSIFYGIFEFCHAARRRLRDGDKGANWECDMPGEFARRLDYLANPNPPPKPRLHS